MAAHVHSFTLSAGVVTRVLLVCPCMRSRTDFHSTCDLTFAQLLSVRAGVGTWALRVSLCALACLLPYQTLKSMPLCMEYLNLTTCIEMMRNDELVREVMQEQKGAKQRKAIQVSGFTVGVRV